MPRRVVGDQLPDLLGVGAFVRRQKARELIAAGIAASLGIIAATFPLLRRITGPEVARNE